MNWHTKKLDDILNELESNAEYGLTEKQVTENLTKYGDNTLKEKKKTNLLTKFLVQFNDFMIVVLITAAFTSFMVSYINGEKDILDPIIILIIIIINAILGLVQESKAEKSIEALKKMAAQTSKVIRDGVVKNIKTENVTVGDLIVLETGDLVPADGRLISCVNLKTEESALTGESLPVEKNYTYIGKIGTPLGNRINMVYSGSSISYGRGTAIITDIGMKTEVGKIAHMIIEDEAPETPLQKKLSQTGKYLGIGALSICIGIFSIGIIQSIPPFEMFMTSVGLAVAAIPEGLPAIVTILLAIGVQRMAKKNAIIRKLPAVETLGSASVICSDKTGTLTQNKMTVTTVYDANGDILNNNVSKKYITKLCVLCNDTIVQENNGKLTLLGDPTEKALINLGITLGINKKDLLERTPRVHEIPFESKRKLMTTVHKMENGSYMSITKGALDILLHKCNFYYENGKVLPLNEYKKKKILNNNSKMANKALRVIAVAYKDLNKLTIDKNTLEKDLIFTGLLGLIDPPREGVKKAVQICKNAGIKPVMITGDHVITAEAIGKKLGISTDTTKSITGTELDSLSQKELIKNIDEYSIFARVSPEHKVRIVKAFQSSGNVVAMTGDGVNDAPALKVADIGCAMGISGTDVSKGASDIILTNDNFSTIVHAIYEGRGIYSNIRKAIHFLLSSNIGEIVTIFIAIFFGWDTPLLAIHLLWVNLVTDSLPAIALGLEPAEKNIMYQKPFNSKKSLFSDGLWLTIIVQGLMIGMLSLLAYGIGSIYFDNTGEVIIGRTMAFATLSISQLFHAFNIKTDHSLFEINIFKNIYLVIAFIIGFILQILVISVPTLANIFKVTNLSIKCWLIIITLCIMPIILVEIQKLIFNKKADFLCN